jgi:valyl-tRNA synthetase
MPIPDKYIPNEVENKWYAYWMQHEYFYSVPNEKKPYTIVIPPPNVTGSLTYGTHAQQYHSRCIDSPSTSERIQRLLGSRKQTTLL